MEQDICINGIQTNNLKNIDIHLKKGKINLIIGPSGSGKSSLAYDTIAQIGQHEFLAMYSDSIAEPKYKVKSFSNITVSVPIQQINHNNNVRSTIGTYFGLNQIIRDIYTNTFNLPQGTCFVLNKEENLCRTCHGLGVIPDLDKGKIIDFTVAIGENPFRCWNRYKDFYRQILQKYCDEVGINPEYKFSELNSQEQKLLLYGESKKKYSIRYKKVNSLSSRTTKYYGVLTGKPLLPNFSISKKFWSDKVCPDCLGKKYSPEVESYKIEDLSIGKFMLTPFNQLIKFIEKLKHKRDMKNLQFSIQRLERFIKTALKLNLGHLFLHRTIPTLSGGELQRLRLVQLLNTQLTDLLIVLDEPLAGLSAEEQSDVYREILSLLPKHTLVIVDHGNRFFKVAANIIVLGHGGGKNGGYIVDSQQYIEEQTKVYPYTPVSIKKCLRAFFREDIYQYKGIDVTIAENCLNLVQGKSGVGKSIMMREYFPKIFKQYCYITQKPLLGNKNSSVATALKIFRHITDLFAKRFHKDKNFFSNLTGSDGACPACGGAGYLEYGNGQTINKLECSECDGTGFNKNLRKYKINGMNIFDIWQMSIKDAIDYFKVLDSRIAEILIIADSIMLGHLLIGQPTATLSGGENIRVKILKNSQSRAKIWGIDEPFRGLDNTEIYKVICYLEKIRKKGKTIVVIDHTENIKKYFSQTIFLKNKDGWLTI